MALIVHDHSNRYIGMIRWEKYMLGQTLYKNRSQMEQEGWHCLSKNDENGILESWIAAKSWCAMYFNNKTTVYYIILNSNGRKLKGFPEVVSVIKIKREKNSVLAVGAQILQACMKVLDTTGNRQQTNTPQIAPTSMEQSIYRGTFRKRSGRCPTGKRILWNSLFQKTS